MPVTLNAMCKPGPAAVAGMQTVGMIFDQVGLVLYLDPDSVSIMPPEDKGQWPEFVRLLRELRDGADQMATILEAATEEG